MRKVPSFLDKINICIICEGFEEYEYLNKLKELKIWNPIYNIILKNAECNTNIPAYYQNEYQMDSNDIVLIFCDTDRQPYEQYNKIKEKINAIHGVDNAADNVIIYGNPCTM